MKPIRLVFGSNEFFVESRTKALLEDYSQWALETFDGAFHNINELKQTLDHVLTGLQTMDFFASQKCVWLKATNLLASDSPALTEGGKAIAERWIEGLRNLPEGVLLVISAVPVDKRTTLFKTLQGLSEWEELDDKQSELYLTKIIQQCSKQLGVGIEADARELLFQKLNKQPRAIANEFEKLACFKAFQGSITYDDVLQCTPTWANDEFFEPVEAFYEQNETRYLRSLRDYFILKNEARALLSALQNRNRLHIQLAALKLPSVSKVSLDKAYARYQETYGPINDKSSFCIFSQNPWYLSRIKTRFSLKTLLEIQKELVTVFDRTLSHPKYGEDWLKHLARFFAAE